MRREVEGSLLSTLGTFGSFPCARPASCSGAWGHPRERELTVADAPVDQVTMWKPTEAPRSRLQKLRNPLQTKLSKAAQWQAIKVTCEDPHQEVQREARGPGPPGSLLGPAWRDGPGLDGACGCCRRWCGRRGGGSGWPPWSDGTSYRSQVFPFEVIIGRGGW